MLRFIGIFCVLLIALIIIVAGTVGGLALYDKKAKYPDVPQGVNIPVYSAAEIDYKHRFSLFRGVPYASGAAIDVDNDGRDEIFLGGGVRQSDGLFVYEKGGFVDVSDEVGLVKLGDGVTTGSAVFDIDGNGFRDLIVSRENGIFIYRNSGKGFSLQKLDIEFSGKDIPLAVTVTDVNRDGHIDFLIPFVERGTFENWFLLKETQKRTLARLFVNNGEDNFVDLTESVGLQYAGGALQAAFTDLDADGLEDMVVLYTDGSLMTWKNHGDLLFENKHHSMSNLRGDFLGMAIGDYNRDGRVDFLLTSRGATIPDFLARIISKYRPLRHSQWVLMKNMGFFSFHDEAEKAQLANYELTRGAVLADLNSDGRCDIIASQNHPYWPAHYFSHLRLPGRSLLQDNKGQFYQISRDAGLGNMEMGVTPILADVNGDGLADIVQINLRGPGKVLVRNPGQNNYLKIVLPDTAKSIGAKVSVKMLSGRMVERQFLPGKELCSDSTHALFVGLGKEKATDVMVDYSTGKKDQTSGVLFNTIIEFK